MNYHHKLNTSTMRIVFSALLILSLTVARAQSFNTLNLMPVPRTLVLENGKFLLSPGFTISLITEKTDSLVLLAANRMFNALNRRTGLYFSQENISMKNNSDTASLVIRVLHQSPLVIGADEHYEIRISDKKIMLDANTSIGALRGMQTLLQLVDTDHAGYYFPALHITDEPRFAWRGLMIDVARHFIPADVLRRNIEAMSAVKLNVLHLHLSDDQGFRLESKRFPLLHEKGSNGEYYTQAEMKDIIRFARERGILIVPEFDMPSHASSWFAGYPELATKPGKYSAGSPFKIDRSKPVSVTEIMKTVQSSPFPTFQPTKESVFAFLDQFIGEMAALFPAPYFHIGADENNGIAWKQDSVVARFMRKNNLVTPHDMQAYFVNKVHLIVSKYGKKTIGWDDMFSKNLPKDVLVQVWSPMAPPTLTQQVIEHGNPLILSKGLYLDHFYPAYIHYKIDFPSEEILGGECAQWTEIADGENIETRIWPRAAAIAERFWSPKTVTDTYDMYRRLFIISDELAESGLLHQANYDRMVKRFSAGYSYTATKNLMDVLTPVKGYKRLFRFMTLPESYAYAKAPLVRAADIAMIDPRNKWMFRNSVIEFLRTKNPEAEKTIRDQLTIWSANYQQLIPLFESSPLAKEIEAHSRNLSELSQVCLEVLDLILAGKQPGTEWFADKQSLLKAAAGSQGDVELSVLPELTALITQQLAGLPESYPLF
jgi:hexosaminidase